VTQHIAVCRCACRGAAAGAAVAPAQLQVVGATGCCSWHSICTNAVRGHRRLLVHPTAVAGCTGSWCRHGMRSLCSSVHVQVPAAAHCSAGCRWRLQVVSSVACSHRSPWCHVQHLCTAYAPRTAVRTCFRGAGVRECGDEQASVRCWWSQPEHGSWRSSCWCRLYIEHTVLHMRPLATTSGPQRALACRGVLSLGVGEGCMSPRGHLDVLRGFLEASRVVDQGGRGRER
jgi:hypothetical protein